MTSRCPRFASRPPPPAKHRSELEMTAEIRVIGSERNLPCLVKIAVDIAKRKAGLWLEGVPVMVGMVGSVGV